MAFPDENLEHYGTLVLGLVGEAVIVTDASGGIRLFNPAAEEMFGYGADQVVGRPVEVLIPARHHAQHAADVRAFADREGAARRTMGRRRKVFGRRSSGKEFPVEATVTRHRVRGDVTLAVVLRDVSEQRQLEHELEEGKAAIEQNEHRLRLALQGGRMGTWCLDLSTGRLELDPAARHLWGLPPDGELRFRRALRRIHPDDAGAFRDEVRRAAAERRPFEAEVRILQSDRQPTWMACKGEVVSPTDGRTGTLMGVTFDVTEQREAEELRRIVAAEINHRMRNQMTLVQSVAWLTARDADTVQAYRRKLEERLQLLTEEFALPVDGPGFVPALRDLLAVETRPYRRPDGTNVLLEGPGVTLDKSAAVALRLAVHELVTNAAKHGALGAPAGLLRVSWRTEPAGRQTRIVLLWEEEGGPPVSPPNRRGFGSDLIERTIRRQLRGDVKLDYQPEGLRCEIVFYIGGGDHAAPETPSPRPPAPA